MFPCIFSHDIFKSIQSSSPPELLWQLLSTLFRSAVKTNGNTSWTAWCHLACRPGAACLPLRLGMLLQRWSWITKTTKCRSEFETKGGGLALVLQLNWSLDGLFVRNKIGGNLKNQVEKWSCWSRAGWATTVSLCRNLLDQVGLLLSEGGELIRRHDGGGRHLCDLFVTC